MHGQRHVEVLRRREDRVVARIAVGHARDGERTDERAAAAVLHRALELARGLGGIAEREMGDGDQPAAGVAAEVGDPAVVGAAVRARELGVEQLGLPQQARAWDRARPWPSPRGRGAARAPSCPWCRTPRPRGTSAPAWGGRRGRPGARPHRASRARAARAPRRRACPCRPGCRAGPAGRSSRAGRRSRDTRSRRRPRGCAARGRDRPARGRSPRDPAARGCGRRSRSPARRSSWPLPPAYLGSSPGDSTSPALPPPWHFSDGALSPPAVPFSALTPRARQDIVGTGMATHER